METLSRKEAIDRLRAHFLTLVDEDHPICEVVARQGIFCRGYDQWSDEELRQRFHWIAGPRPHATREQLESLISLYKVARQEALEVPLSCDAQALDRDTCMGWDDFSDLDLEHHVREILGLDVRVNSRRTA